MDRERYGEREKEPLVSVIIPVHNAAATIEAAVDSALGQTWKNLEILLIDDESEDETGRMCEALAQKHPRVRLAHRQSSGVSGARNLGLSLARGEWITFLDADDMMMPSLVRTLLELAQDTSSQIAGCGFWIYTESPSISLLHEKEKDMEQDKDKEKREKITLYTGEEFAEKGILQSDTRIWSKIFRRDLIGDHRFPEDLTIGEDMFFLLSLLPGAQKIARIDTPLYAYYQNPAGAMERPYTPSFMDQTLCWEKAQFFIEEQFPALWEKAAVQSKVAAIQCISAMLVAGKLMDRSGICYQEEREKIAAKLRRYLQVPGAAAALPGSYRLKVRAYLLAPGVYCALYGKMRELRRN